MKFETGEVQGGASSLDLVVNIRSKGGVVRLHAQSPLFENYVEKLATETAKEDGAPVMSTNPGTGGMRYYYMRERPMLSVPTFWNDVSRPPLVDGQVNLSWLRVVGLSKGVAFTWNTPWSKEIEERFLTRLRTAVTEYFDTYMRDREIYVRFSVEEKPF